MNRSLSNHEIAPSRILAQPLLLKSEAIPNRLAKAAMTEGLADAQGLPTDALVRLYRQWGRSGAGLLLSGNIMIDRNHLERPGNVILDGPPDAEMKQRLRAWSSAAREAGAGFWLQVNHSGRQTPNFVNPNPKSASDVPLALPGRQYGRPVPLEENEIHSLIDRYATACVSARETGFSGAQIHAAHGHLISQFLAPRSNRRTDAWGGSLENRARFLLEIVRKARTAVGPDFTLSVKLNSADFQNGGFEFADSLQVARWLQAAGIDLLEISGGTLEAAAGMAAQVRSMGTRETTQAREAYFIGFAEAIHGEVDIPLMVTGGFSSARTMADAISSGAASLIGLGRPLCVEPLAPTKLLRGAPTIPRHEGHLRIGPGWLGPSSPFVTMRTLNSFGALFWHYQQIRRLAAGQPGAPKMSVWRALRRERREQRSAQRRALSNPSASRVR